MKNYKLDKICKLCQSTENISKRHKFKGICRKCIQKFYTLEEQIKYREKVKTKQCNRCNQILSANSENFHYSAESLDGLQLACRNCKAEYAKKLNASKPKKGPIKKKTVEELDAIHEQNRLSNPFKVCRTCGIERPNTTDFFSKVKESVDGLLKQCKECCNEYSRNLQRRPEQIKKSNARYVKKRHESIEFRLKDNVSSYIYTGLKKQYASKNNPSWSRLPYTPKDLKEHLEKQFDKIMSWENYGTYWQIDHIIPCAALQYKSLDDENFQKCWSLSNLRPLKRKENIAKSSYYNGKRHFYNKDKENK